jgi:hypothetical protein
VSEAVTRRYSSRASGIVLPLLSDSGSEVGGSYIRVQLRFYNDEGGELVNLGPLLLVHAPKNERNNVIICGLSYLSIFSIKL